MCVLGFPNEIHYSQNNLFWFQKKQIEFKVLMPGTLYTLFHKTHQLVFMFLCTLHVDTKDVFLPISLKMLGWKNPNENFKPKMYL